MIIKGNIILIIKVKQIWRQLLPPAPQNVPLAECFYLKLADAVVVCEVEVPVDLRGEVEVVLLEPPRLQPDQGDLLTALN